MFKKIINFQCFISDKMYFCRNIIFILLILVLSLQADETVDQFVEAYEHYHLADQLINQNHSLEALSEYNRAEDYLLDIKRTHPLWKSSLLNYRLHNIQHHIHDLEDTLCHVSQQITISPQQSLIKNINLPLLYSTIDPQKQDGIHSLFVEKIELPRLSTSKTNPIKTEKGSEHLSSIPLIVSKNVKQELDQIQVIQKDLNKIEQINDQFTNQMNHLHVNSLSEINISHSLILLSDMDVLEEEQKKLLQKIQNNRDNDKQVSLNRSLYRNKADISKLKTKIEILKNDRSQQNKSNWNTYNEDAHAKVLIEQNKILEHELQRLTDTMILLVQDHHSTLTPDLVRGIQGYMLSISQHNELFKKNLSEILEWKKLQEQVLNQHEILLQEMWKKNANLEFKIKKITEQKDQQIAELNSKIVNYSHHLEEDILKEKKDRAEREKIAQILDNELNKVNIVIPPLVKEQIILLHGGLNNQVIQNKNIQVTINSTDDTNKIRTTIATHINKINHMEETAPLIQVIEQTKEDIEHHDYKQAEIRLKQAIQSNPNDYFLLANLGVVEFQLGKFEEAETILKRAIQSDRWKKNSFALTTLGIVHFKEGRVADGETILKRALAINNRDYTAHNYLGIILVSEGHLHDGACEIMKALDINPQYADAHFNMAVLCVTEQPPAINLAKKHYQLALQYGANHDPSLDKIMQ